MKEVDIEKALTYIEPGPLVLVTTFDGQRNNVMTISWTMAIDFAQHIVLTTGPWNRSFTALLEKRECVVCIPPVSMLETAVRIGMVSGVEVDKFEKFGLKALPAQTVEAPLVDGCIACLECRVTDYIDRYGFIILKVTRVVENSACIDRRIIHAKGDGTFTVDGESFNCRELMLEKLPPGL